MPRRRGRGWWQAPLVAVLAALLSAGAIAFFHREGSLLFYGDAVAHINIARRVTDSRTPGPKQIGTVWLPLPHAAMLPLVRRDDLWRNGLAGAVPSAAAFVLAAVCLFLAARRIYGSGMAGALAAALFAFNPNLLYLQSVPMTEALWLGCFALTLYGIAVFMSRPRAWLALLAGLTAACGSLTRYEGWWMLPFFALAILWTGGRRRWGYTLLFVCAAGLGPLAWFAHNWWFWGDALEFYRGPWSAHAIQGAGRYPGRGDWAGAFQQYGVAAWHCAGAGLTAVGAAGAAVALWRRHWKALALLACPPAFYVASVHSGGTPIYVPDLEPFSYYNTRYGTAILPLLAVAGGGLALLRGRWLPLVALGVSLGFWLAQPDPEAWIVRKEAEVNSTARRAWTSEAARFLSSRYTPGSGILMTFGDLTGVLQQAGIPLRETLTWDADVVWHAAVARPDLFLRDEWAITIAGDPVHTAILRTELDGPRYTLQRRIVVRNAPVIEIFRRDSQRGLREQFSDPRDDE